MESNFTEVNRKQVIQRVQITTLDRSQSLKYDIFSGENLEEVLWETWGDEMFELEI